MSRLVESIKVLNGKIYNLKEHQSRFTKTRYDVFGSSSFLSLREIIHQNSIPKSGLYKCRILYDKNTHSVEFIPYLKPHIRQLKCIFVDSVTYDYKWENREQLDALYNQRGTANEIIIVRDGLLTDGYYYNYVFEINGHLITPNKPLLAGTQRARLLKRGLILEEEIQFTDLKKVSKIFPINAMNPLGSISLTTHQIINI